MYLLRSLAIAISMYSKIPVPMVDWNEKNMKYAMCFFPVVGAVTGGLQLLIGYLLLEYTSCGNLFFAIAMALIPVTCIRRDPSGRVRGYGGRPQFLR